jgi:general secretion pathway protein A
MMKKHNANNESSTVMARLYRQFQGRAGHPPARLGDIGSDMPAALRAARAPRAMSISLGKAGDRADDRTPGTEIRDAETGSRQDPQVLPDPGSRLEADTGAGTGGWKFRSRRHLADVAPLEKGYVSPNLPDVQVSGEPMVSVSSARPSTDAVLVLSLASGNAVRNSEGRESEGRHAKGRNTKGQDAKGQDAAPLAKKSVANPPSPPTRQLTMASALDLYNDHFGLKERPFSLLPDPDFLFWSPAHRRAYTMLEYGILTCAPITLITGDVGAGKTTLVQHLLRTIDERVKIGLISNAHGSRGELLRWVLMSLGQSAAHEATYVDLFATFQAYLIEEYGRGNRVILIFDEAQNLSRDALEELRMFTNINANKDELLQLVLVGQPELRDIVRRPDMRQFAQRVAANFHLSTMDAPTVRAYIAHRLKVAGNDRNVFSRAATDLIHKVTGGVPRLVNQLCDLSMVYTFTKNQKIIMSQTVQRVLEDGAFFAAGLDTDASSGAPLGHAPRNAPRNVPDGAGTLDED